MCSRRNLIVFDVVLHVRDDDDDPIEFIARSCRHGCVFFEFGLFLHVGFSSSMNSRKNPFLHPL